MKANLQRCVWVLCVSATAALAPVSDAQAQWKYGIGTGLSGQYVSGTQGFTTFAGPVKFDVDLSASDFKDLSKSAFGFGGYAANGPWLIQYSLGYQELEDESTAAVGGSTVTTKINFKVSGGEATAGYLVSNTPSALIYVDGGVRYTKHKFDNSLTVTGAINQQGSRAFSNDWTDVVVGTTINVPLSPTWTWANRLNAGFGGSDGTYFAQTGLTWRFLPNWSASLVGKYAKVKYEKGNEGDSDWYLYDVDEKSIGLSVLYNW